MAHIFTPKFEVLKKLIMEPKGVPHRILAEFIVFGIKQAWACLFGGSLLTLILITAYIYPEDALLSRYDFLFLAAIAIQMLLIAFKLEKPAEVKVIILFHIVGTIMEIFKTHMGSWQYPESNLLRIGGVPLFSGFMYSAVGSYLARVWRSFDFRFSHHPPVWMISLTSLLIYINFFSHHFIIDVRPVLFAAVGILFFKTRVYFRILESYRHMPLLLGFFLTALFIWFAENISTFAHIWLYPSQQNGWAMISFGKLGSWFLLIIISYGMIARLHEITAPPQRDSPP